MSAIAVTGAAGAVGRRTVRRLVGDPRIDRVVAIDRVAGVPPMEGVETVRTDLRRADLARAFADCTTVVHLAEEQGEPSDSTQTLAMLDAVLVGAEAAGVARVVGLSSAMAYGAHEDNPIPLTESHPLRADDGLPYAKAKADLEAQLGEWCRAGSGRRCTVLRPTTTLSEHGAAWAAKAIRSAMVVRPDQVDPPLQFLHYDDLSSALSHVVGNDLDGVFNVAPDGWVGPDVFRDLVGGIQLRIPDRINDRLLGLGRRIGVRTPPDGIDSYIRHPWVVANDRLRQSGWEPVFSNSEAFVIGTPAPPWSVSAKERQEIALAVAGAGLAGAAAVAAAVARRAVK